MTCGIYKLCFKGTDKVYVGQSVNIERRYSAHKASFIHRNASKKMQEAYQEYGIPSLEIIEKVSIEEDLSIYEDYYIKEYRAYSEGFNSLEYADSVPIKKSTGILNGTSKYSLEQIYNTFELLVDTILTVREISEITKVPDATVYTIKSCCGHTWLKECYPDEYAILCSKNSIHGNAAKSRGTTYPSILDPIGTKYTINNRSAFCREHNLDCGAIGRVLRKVAKSHKGWRLCPEEQVL